MTKSEANKFIDAMEDYNDSWEVDQVMDVYGSYDLADAISERTGRLAQEAQNIAALIR